MPAESDPAIIRAILRTDAPWSIYAIGDLEPAFFEHCSWHVTRKPAPGLILVYRAFSPPVIFAMGKSSVVADLLGELDLEPGLYLHVRPEIVSVLARHYRVVNVKNMWRMVLDVKTFQPADDPGVVPLQPADLGALNNLYADGDASGEAPDFFFESMLQDGVFTAVREGRDLVAVAGTHLVAPSERVAAIGNVYTRRDRRGQGLAARTTRALVSALLGMKIELIALNVNQQNAAAIRTYERLGFRKHCAYCEGVAEELVEAAAGPAR